MSLGPALLTLLLTGSGLSALPPAPPAPAPTPAPPATRRPADDPPAGRQIQVWYGTQLGGSFGLAVAAAGDVDQDGSPDVLVAAPTGGPHSAGQVQLRSGVDGRLLRSLDAPDTPADFGASLAGGLDMDGDEIPDLVVGAPRLHSNGVESGATFLYSGRTGRELRTLPGDGIYNFMGSAVTLLPDADGDGRPELVSGANRGSIADGSRPGTMLVVSGNRPEPCFQLAGAGPDDTLGHALDRAGDVDGDGVPDLIVGALGSDQNGPECGMVWVVSGADGRVIHEWIGAAGADRFGSAVAGLGDVDGDGHPDLAVGAPGHDGGGDAAGTVFVYSGLDGALITSVSGAGIGDGLGSCLAAVGDVDGDGIPDLAVSARQEFRGELGYVLICSGRDGRVIVKRVADDHWQGLGLSLAGVGDLDGDGRDDVAVGAPQARRDGKLIGAVLLLGAGDDDGDSDR